MRQECCAPIAMSNGHHSSAPAPKVEAGPSPAAAGDATVGLAAALGAFLLWGLSPLYFWAVDSVGPWQIVAHRILWTFVLLALLLAALGRLGEVVATVRDWSRLRVFLVTTALITVNWTLFIWAILNDRLLEASLGYYINPLVNVLLGVVFLSERLTRWQGVAVALAALGCANLVIGYGSFPWIALTLAFSFGFYGLVRKQARADSLIGLMIETAILTPAMLAYLIWVAAQGGGVFWTGGIEISLLLVAAGLVTGTPLVLFTMGANRLKLSTMGLIQYVAPTIQFVLAVAVFAEPFTTAHLVTFACIWIGLALYSWDAVTASDRQRRRLADTAKTAP